jgi:hypothetical protein
MHAEDERSRRRQAVVFNIRGPSWRLREHNRLEIATDPERGRR